MLLNCLKERNLMDESIIKEAVDEEWQRIVSKIKGIFVKRYNYLYGKMIGCTFSGVGKLTEMKAIMGP